MLVDFDHRIAAEKIAQHCRMSGQEIYELFFNSETTRLFEEGRLLQEDFFLRIKSALKLRIDFQDFLPIWNQIFFLSPKNRKVYELASRLKGTYRTAVLSNINVLHYEYLKQEFDVFGAFHWVFVSCELGLVKPDPKIYRKALAQLGVSAAETFYTDDRAELIESAQRLGIKSFVFRGAEQLQKDLLQAGVDIN